MEYFSKVKTVQGATKRYRALAKKWHPDRNGLIDAGAVMAEINRQYKEVLVSFANESKAQEATASSEMPEADNPDNLTDTEERSNPNSGSAGATFDDAGRSKGRTLRVKSFIQTFVSDQDVDNLGKAAEVLAVRATKSVIAKGVLAIKKWAQTV